jgi:hypothetical protein
MPVRPADRAACPSSAVTSRHEHGTSSLTPAAFPKRLLQRDMPDRLAEANNTRATSTRKSYSLQYHFGMCNLPLNQRVVQNPASLGLPPQRIDTTALLKTHNPQVAQAFSPLMAFIRQQQFNLLATAIWISSLAYLL